MTRPKTCKAVVLERYNEPLVIREVPIPETLEPGAILVRIELASVCGSDVHLWTGELAQLVTQDLPLVPGHEMVGRIVEFGEGVSHDSVGNTLALGDRILWSHASCGKCHNCKVLNQPTLCTERKFYGFTRSLHTPPYLNGGFAEYCYVLPTSGVVRIPDEVKSEWASSVGCALRTVMNGFDRLDDIGGLGFMDTVVVQGAGPLGLYTTAVCSRRGPGTIIVIGGPPNRLEVARRWGATATVPIEDYPTPAARIARVKELTDGKGASVVFEMSGAHHAFAEGLEMAALGGKYVSVGPVGGPPTPIPAEMITRKNLTIAGVFSADIKHYYRGLEFVRRYRHEIDFDLLISSSYAMVDVNAAIDNMHHFRDVKSVLRIQSDTP